MKAVLVIGHPYSGLEYVTKVLHLHSLEVGHEELKMDGGVGWKFATGLVDQFRVVWQATRNPLAVIADALRDRNPVRPPKDYDFGNTMLTALLERTCTPVGAAAASWFAWNTLCEDKLTEARRAGRRARRFQVEDPYWYQEIALACQLEWNQRTRDRIESLKPPNMDGAFTWKDLEADCSASLYDKVRNMAEIYGYPGPE